MQLSLREKACEDHIQASGGARYKTLLTTTSDNAWFYIWKYGLSFGGHILFYTWALLLVGPMLPLITANEMAVLVTTGPETSPLSKYFFFATAMIFTQKCTTGHWSPPILPHLAPTSPNWHYHTFVEVPDLIWHEQPVLHSHTPCKSYRMALTQQGISCKPTGDKRRGFSPWNVYNYEHYTMLT